MFPGPLFSFSVPSQNINYLFIWISPNMGQAVYYFKITLNEITLVYIAHCYLGVFMWSLTVLNQC